MTTNTNTNTNRLTKREITALTPETLEAYVQQRIKAAISRHGARTLAACTHIEVSGAQLSDSGFGFTIGHSEPPRPIDPTDPNLEGRN